MTNFGRNFSIASRKYCCPEFKFKKNVVLPVINFGGLRGFKIDNLANLGQLACKLLRSNNTRTRQMNLVQIKLRLLYFT